MTVPARRDWFRITVFILCLAFFVIRGPYRALRYSTTGDFSTVYAAARTWVHGSNPYERSPLEQELMRAGSPEHIRRDQRVNPSVYLPSAFPLLSPLTWLSWPLANTLWCLLSLALYGLALLKILRVSRIYNAGKWLAASGALLFSPTYVGIYDGNPSVAAISMLSIAVCLATESSVAGCGLWLGIAVCLKPQIAVCGFALLILWRRWSSITIAMAVFFAASVAGITVACHFGQDWSWLHAEQANIALSFQPGGQSDPRPNSVVGWQFLNAQSITSYVFRAPQAYNLAAWALAALLTAMFFLSRRPWSRPTQLRDVAFAATLTLVITYHRYYDAQLLLLLLPYLSQKWQGKERMVLVAVGACLLLLAAPIQSVFARMLGAKGTIPSPEQFLLLRIQPLATLVLAATLASAPFLTRRKGTAERSKLVAETET